MPIVPSLLEQLFLLRLNQGPAPLLDLFGALGFRAVVAGLRLGVFDALLERPATAVELAGRLQADARGMAALLGALAALGYVRQRNGRYRATPMTARWMARASRDSVAAGFEFWAAALDELWRDLEGWLRSGQPSRSFHAWLEQRPAVQRAYQAWDMAAARNIAPAVAATVRLPPTARRLLDVGGGHGLYSLAFCRRYPGLQATLVDRPGALEVARETIASAGMAERVEARPGDLLADELGSGYDAALLCHVAHGLGREQNLALLRKVAAALVPGGLVVILEQFADEAPGPTSNAIARLMDLFYHQALGGQLYTAEDLAHWLAATGFPNAWRLKLPPAPGEALVVGRKGGRTLGEAHG